MFGTVRTSAWLRTMLAGITSILLALAWVPAVVNAQDGLVDDTTYEMQAGQTVTWSAPWAFESNTSDEEAGIEGVTLTTQMGIASLITLPVAIDIEVARDAFLEGLVGEADAAMTIDQGSYDDITYSLDILALEGLEFGAFSTVRRGTSSVPTFLTIVMAPTSAFASEFSSAQESIAVDGTAIFPGVGGQGLQDLLLDNAGFDGSQPSDDGGDDAADGSGDATDDGADATDDGADATDDGADDGADDGGDSGSSGGKLAPGGDTEETPDATDDGADDDSADATDDGADDGSDDGTDGGDPTETGLIDDNTFIGPAHLVEIAWDTNWTLNTEMDSPVVEDADGVDGVYLLAVGDEVALLSVTVIEAPEATADGIVNFWQSDEFLDSFLLSPDGDVLLGDSSGDTGAVVYIDYTDQGTELVIYRQAWYLEDQNAIAYVSMTTLPGILESRMTAAMDGVTIDGTPILTYFTADEILGAI